MIKRKLKKSFCSNLRKTFDIHNFCYFLKYFKCQKKKKKNTINRQIENLGNEGYFLHCFS